MSSVSSICTLTTAECGQKSLHGWQKFHRGKSWQISLCTAQSADRRSYSMWLCADAVVMLCSPLNMLCIIPQTEVVWCKKAVATTSLNAGMARQTSSGPSSGSGRPPLPGGGPPPSGPGSGGQPTASRSAVRSRYVSSFNSGSNPS